MVDLTRRGFLAGLLGTAVIVSLPGVVAPAAEITPIDPWSIKAPPGWTYQWVRTALLGEPDPENVEKRLNNGWAFVVPETHPGAPVSTVEKAIETSGLILMQKRTADVKAYAKQFECKECEGLGKRVVGPTDDGETLVYAPCNACKGSGRA